MTTPTKETHSYHGMFRPPFETVKERASQYPNLDFVCRCSENLKASVEGGFKRVDRKKLLDHWLAGHFDEPVYMPLVVVKRRTESSSAVESFRRMTPLDLRQPFEVPEGTVCGPVVRTDSDDMPQEIRGSIEPPVIRIGTIEVGGTAILGGPEIAESMKAERVPFLDSKKNKIGYADNFRVEGDKTLCDLHVENKSVPGFVGRVRFASGSNDALEIEFPTIDSADLVGEMPIGASELFGAPPQESVFSSNPETIAPGHDIRDHVGELFGRVAGFSTDSSGRTQIVASRVRLIDACPVCFHRFEMGEPPHFKVEDGGQGHDGERAIHWQSGTQTCPNCAATWQYSDSD